MKVKELRTLLALFSEDTNVLVATEDRDAEIFDLEYDDEEVLIVLAEDVG